MNWMAELKEKAEKATKGPWQYQDLERKGCGVYPASGKWKYYPMALMMTTPEAVGHDGHASQQIDNGNFIASAYPERILALIEVVEAAEKLVERRDQLDKLEVSYNANWNPIRNALSHLKELS